MTCEHCGGEMTRCEYGCLHHVRDGQEGSIFCVPGDPATKTAEQ